MFYMTAETVVEDILKELEEAKKYKYPEFVVKQDLVHILKLFEDQITEDVYDDAREDFKSRLKDLHYSTQRLYDEFDDEDEDDDF